MQVSIPSHPWGVGGICHGAREVPVDEAPGVSSTSPTEHPVTVPPAGTVLLPALPSPLAPLLPPGVKNGVAKINRNSLLHSSGGQKAQISFTGLKPRCQQGRPLRGLQGRSWSLALPPSGGCQLALAGGCVTPVSTHVVAAPSPVSGSNLSLFLSYEDTRTRVMHLGPTQIIQDNPLLPKTPSHLQIESHLQRLFLLMR